VCAVLTFKYVVSRCGAVPDLADERREAQVGLSDQ